MLSIPANAYNFIVDYSDAVGKISNFSNCVGLLKDLFDAVAEIKDWCNGVALFPHEKFFSSLQLFGKSYRTTMLSLLPSICFLFRRTKVQKIFGLSKYLHFNFITFPYLFLLIVPYLSRKRVVFVSRSSPARRSEITYLFSSVALFRATLFAGVSCVPSVAQILQRVVAFFCILKFSNRLLEFLISLFIHQFGGVFLHNSITSCNCFFSPFSLAIW